LRTAISATTSLKKAKISEKLFLQKIKKESIQQQILEPKNTVLAIKVENNHVPKK
jgi:hypothetical protein